MGRCAKFLLIVLMVLLILPMGANAARPQQVGAVNELWYDISLGPPLVAWYNQVARPNDIARVDHIDRLDLLDRVTVGRKLVVFKSAAEAEEMIPAIADKVDIVGYNLEHGPANPVDEQADPVGNAKRMRELADTHGLTLAFGPDHDFAVDDGVAVAPYVDIFVLQIQRAQTDPAKVYDFVVPLIPKLREANPDLEISVQVRTEGDVTAIVDLIDSLKQQLDGASILTSAETVEVAEALVEELQAREVSSTVSAFEDRAAAQMDVRAGESPSFGPNSVQSSGPITISRGVLFWMVGVASALVVGVIIGGAVVAVVKK